MDELIRVILVEDDADFVYLIKKMIEKDKRLLFCGEAHNPADGIALAQAARPDIVLMDLNLTKNELDGIGAAREIGLHTPAKVLLLTSFEQPEVVIRASKRAFACGYIFKSGYSLLPEIIVSAATTHTAQEQMIRELILQDLSPAERSVLGVMLGGENTLRSADKTIINQKTNIFKKLGLRNTSELVQMFRRYQ